MQDVADSHPDTALALALDVTDPAQVRSVVVPAEELQTWQSLTLSTGFQGGAATR